MISVQLDDEIERELSHIDLGVLSVPQAQTLGISLGMFDEAKKENQVHTEVYRHNLATGLTIALVSGVAVLVFNVSTVVLAVGIALMLTCSTLFSAFQRSISSTLVTLQRQALIDEIRQLTRPQSESPDIEIEIDVD